MNCHLERSEIHERPVCEQALTSAESAFLPCGHRRGTGPAPALTSHLNHKSDALQFQEMTAGPHQYADGAGGGDSCGRDQRAPRQPTRAACALQAAAPVPGAAPAAGAGHQGCRGRPIQVRRDSLLHVPRRRLAALPGYAAAASAGATCAEHNISHVPVCKLSAALVDCRIHTSRLMSQWQAHLWWPFCLSENKTQGRCRQRQANAQHVSAPHLT